MQITLLVPGLSWPREILRDIAPDLELPALSALLGKGRISGSPGSVAARLAAAFGVAGPLPAAPLRLLAGGGAPGGDAWLCLDPVHLRLEARTAHAVVVDDPARLALTAGEDAALRETLAPLFEEFGEPSGELVATSPGRWHLRLALPTGIDTQPLPEAVGRAADPGLPAGPDAPRWRGLLAEAQTLLFEHPVNRARREAGRPAANSLWPWGEGRLPARVEAPFDAALGDDPILAGLARAVAIPIAGIPAAGAPATFEAVPRRTLVRLDALVEPTRDHDALAWREALLGLEAGWFAPLLGALAAGRCRRLRLWAGGAEGFEAELAPRDLLKFWRRPKPLALACP